MTPEENFRQFKLRQICMTPEYQMWKDQYDVEEKAAHDYHESFMSGLHLRQQTNESLIKSLEFIREEDIRFRRRWITLGLAALAALCFLYWVIERFIPAMTGHN